MEKTTRKGLEEMNIQEIEEYGLLKEYEKELQGMKTDPISRRVVDELYGESIMDIAYAIDEEKLNNTSISLFPNHLVKVYPSIKMSHTKKERTCDFCSARIYKGKLYVNWRPMIRDITANKAYVLSKSITVCEYCEKNLPEDIEGIEDLNNKIMYGTEQDDVEIFYSHLSCQTGGELIFKQLRRVKNENRYCK